MNVLFPPVLESQAIALPYQVSPPDDIVKIRFTMPETNDITQIKHIQVVIKYTATNSSAVNANYSPDRATLFLPVRDPGGAVQTTYWENIGSNCTIKIPYRFFMNGAPERATVYSIQVRFGSNSIWGAGDDSVLAGDVADFAGFAAWRALQVAQVPSAFGEWSNRQTQYFYGDAAVELTYNLNDFVPELVYTYAPEDNDPLDYVQVNYEYQNVFKRQMISKVYSGQLLADGTYTVRIKLPIAPVTLIKVSLEAITTNYTIRGKTLNITPLSKELPNTGPLPLILNPGYFSDWQLKGEEIDDGAIAKILTVPEIPATGTTISIYRVDMFTLGTIRVQDNIAVASTLYEYYLKDFSVEMGADYMYVAVYKVAGIATGLVTPLYPWGFTNSGCGRLKRMDSTYLEDNCHQLRIQGNVEISSFKRNVSGQFQTTIGSKYPFYSRAAEVNYRSFQLQGVVTINFDPTGTFFRHDYEDGLYWETDKDSQLVILNRDLFGEENFSRSRHRAMDEQSGSEFIVELGKNDGSAIRGPSSVYDNYMYRNTIPNIDTSRSDEIVYMERRFREKVMEWLADGKPKLFRSETEGNMIIMASDVTFSPLQGTGRIVYTVSMTCTEIAEYNLDNLVEYNLVPINIFTKIIHGFPYNLKVGDKINENVYVNIMRIAPELTGSFIRVDEDYIITPGADLASINKVLDSITDYSFVRGLPEKELYDKLIFDDSPNFDIPMLPIGSDLEIDLWPGIRYNTSDKDSHTVTFTVVSGALPDNTKIDGHKIVIDDTTRGIGARNTSQVVIEASDENGDTTRFTIDVGYIYDTLYFGFWGWVDHYTTQDEVQVEIRSQGGVPFYEVSGIPDDIDYIYSASWLPYGLSIGKFMKGGREVTGIIGKFTKEMADFFTYITITDARGETYTRRLDFRNIMSYPMITTSAQDDIGYLEFGTAIPPVDIRADTVGGSGNFKYKIKVDSAHPIPGGLSIDSTTGIISGIPDRTTPGTENGGYFVVEVCDLDIDPTGTETHSSVVINYGRLLDTFIFINPSDGGGTWRVLDIYGNAANNWEMPVGTNLPVRQILGVLDPAGNPIISGGLPFIDENGNPYYKFKAENLYPDYKVSLKGAMSGRASVASPQRTAKIIAIDARGAEREVELTIAPITSLLTFAPETPLIIDAAIVRTDPTPYSVDIPLSWVTGGHGSYHIATVGVWPDYMEVVTLTDASGGQYWQVRPILGVDYPYPEKEPIELELEITDDSAVPQTARFKVAVGRVVQVLDASTGYFEVVNGEVTQLGKSFRMFLSNYVTFTGGIGPYTLAANTDADAAIMAPYIIYQTEAAEQDPNKFRIEGVIQDRNERVFDVRLTDAMGQTRVITIRIPGAENRLTGITKNSLGDHVLIKDVSTLTNIPVVEGMNGNPFPDVDKPYRYKFKNTSNDENVVIIGVTLDPDTGKISGTPTETKVKYLGNIYFTVQDTVTEVIPQYQWWSPRVVEQISVMQPGGVEVVPSKEKGYFFIGQPMFKGGVGSAKHPNTQYYFEDPTTGALILLKHHDIFYKDAFVWNEELVRIETQKGIGLPELDPNETIIIWAITPRDDFILADGSIQTITPRLETSARVQFGGTVDPLAWRHPGGAVSSDPLSLNVPTMPSVAGGIYTIDIGAYVVGGVAPITYQITTNPGGNWTMTGSTMTRRIDTIFSEEVVEFKAHANDGKEITGRLTFKGTYTPFTVDTSGWNDIAEIVAGTDKNFKWADIGINPAINITGGSGNYRWKIEPVAPATDCLPYWDSRGEVNNEFINLNFNIGTDSYDARQFLITVYDYGYDPTCANPVTKTINVGKVIGAAAQIADFNLAGGVKATTFTFTYNIADYFENGYDYQFTDIVLPTVAEWADGAINITTTPAVPPTTTVTISGTYPTTVTPATTFTAKLVKSGGITGAPDMTITFNIGEVTN